MQGRRFEEPRGSRVAEHRAGKQAGAGTRGVAATAYGIRVRILVYGCRAEPLHNRVFIPGTHTLTARVHTLERPKLTHTKCHINTHTITKYHISHHT